MTQSELERQIIDLTIKAEENKRDAERWRKVLPRVRMMKTIEGTMFYVRGKPVDYTKDCSVAEHFTAAIDAAGEQV